ncbi:hybrid sensor histidine kinase/response regulator transcription factor [Sphingobacterium wenxiniae]|uniref:histidine kinase n=1 Tax=Sphingobacterium wenxiniae TaxID=683125 RepID=A0A1I6R579_9SPHI|nr:response regulator [Sphingobacterium wenxiniae]SFS59658.1 Two component regulator propeller [Sphingobacterium wenxiniae]
MILFLRKILCICTITLLNTQLLTAQNLQFHTLTEENVFDKQPVLSIVQDNNGRLWFAGGTDIYHYNSERITDLKDQDSSWNDIGYITKLAINTDNQLFIASSTGIHIYNTEKQIFTSPPFIVKNNILPLDILDIYAVKNQLYLATKKGLYLILLDSQEIMPLIQGKAVYAFAPINTKLYFATANSVEYLEIAPQINKPSIKKILDIPTTITSDDLITTLFLDQQHIWIGTKLHGIFHYDPSQKKIINYNENNTNLLSNYVRKITKGPNGNVWIGTLKGLSIYAGNTTFQNHYHNSFAPQTLSQNSIYDIFIDRQQIAWIGTYFGGMNVVYPTAIHAKVYATKDTPPFRLSSDIIGSFVESENGYWIGTEEDGINFLDKRTGQIKTVRHYAQSNLIKDLYLKDDKLYIAQFSGGYSIANIKNNSVQNFILSKDTLDVVNNVFSIYTDDNQKVYLGTNVGLYIQNGDNAPPTRDSSVPQTTIHKIKQDNNGNLYLQQGNRLFVKKNREGSFQHIEKLGSLNVSDFFIEANKLWLTVADHVYRLTDFEKLDSIVQLKGNQLGAIVKLADQLWLTSKQGLVYYDLNTQYMNILTKEDGLPSNNLGAAKIYIDQKQNIFLATQNGLVSFSSQDISFNKQKPHVFFSAIKVNDKTLPQQRIETDENTQTVTIHLNHDETFLAIDFAGSNLIRPAKNRYRYMLKGFDSDWKEISSSNIQYSNLPVGEHVLSVYVSNNDGVWSDTPLVIKLIVHPPFYLSWWAFIIYAILILAAIHFIIKFIVEREILINSEKEQEKKIKFFTQISHEIRTPLTLITAPLDEIIHETANQSNTQQKILRIKKNTNKLLAVINELLDFNKFDEKQQKLRLQKIDLSTYLEDSFYLLSDLAQLKELNYYIRRLDKGGLFWIDPQQFDKVMFNLLSNAIKYTPKGGTVYLDFIKTAQGAEICIVDNGVGVSKANQFKIFEEYYRQEATEDVIGTGIGLSLTKKIIEQHSGDIICETLNIDNKSWTMFKISLEQKFDTDTDIQLITSSYKSDTEVFSTVQAESMNDSQETILIIEDNKELLGIITNIFQESYQVITAQDGQEGFDKAKQYLPSLIISDMMMPKINGLQLCQLLKEDLSTSHIPFILLTAVNDENIHTETLKYGANIYLTKPFDKGQLYLSVRNLLAIAQKQRKDFQIKTNIENEIDQKFITTLDQLIEEHIMDDGFDVNYISRAMGMSAPILYRKLKAITDLSLNNYVKSYRLNKAKELLTTSQIINISEVAYAVGFSDRKYFSREFKKQFGITPSEYIAEK